MNNHRYQYVYLPATRLIRKLSPPARWLLLLAKAALIVTLIGFELSRMQLV